MLFCLIITPDNADPAVEHFPCIEKAAARGAEIIRDYEPTWPASEIAALLKAGSALTYHDHSELRLEAVL